MADKKETCEQILARTIFNPVQGSGSYKAREVRATDLSTVSPENSSGGSMMTEEEKARAQVEARKAVFGH